MVAGSLNMAPSVTPMPVIDRTVNYHTTQKRKVKLEIILLDGSLMGAYATWPFKSGVESFVLQVKLR